MSPISLIAIPLKKRMHAHAHASVRDLTLLVIVYPRDSKVKFYGTGTHDCVSDPGEKIRRKNHGDHWLPYLGRPRYAAGVGTTGQHSAAISRGRRCAHQTATVSRRTGIRI